jgi:AraC family transcriptional regulator
MLEDTSTTPKLLVSSEEANWEEIALYAYHEPKKLEGWVAPGTLDSTLTLIARGSLHLEVKPINGAWKAQYLHQGDFLLKPGALQSNELRWQSFSSEPLHMLYISLSHTFLARTAEEMTNGNCAHLALVERAGFQDPLLTQIGLALWRQLEQPHPARLYAQTAAQMLAVHLLQHYTSSLETRSAD